MKNSDKMDKLVMILPKLDTNTINKKEI